MSHSARYVSPLWRGLRFLSYSSLVSTLSSGSPLPALLCPRLSYLYLPSCAPHLCDYLLYRCLVSCVYIWPASSPPLPLCRRLPSVALHSDHCSFLYQLFLLLSFWILSFEITPLPPSPPPLYSMDHCSDFEHHCCSIYVYFPFLSVWFEGLIIVCLYLDWVKIWGMRYEAFMDNQGAKDHQLKSTVMRYNIQRQSKTSPNITYPDCWHCSFSRFWPLDVGGC